MNDIWQYQHFSFCLTNESDRDSINLSMSLTWHVLLPAQWRLEQSTVMCVSCVISECVLCVISECVLAFLHRRMSQPWSRRKERKKRESEIETEANGVRVCVIKQESDRV